MARKISFVLIISIFIGVNLFFSCTKIDDNDHTPPTIEVLSPIPDTVIYVTSDTDTLFPIFRARFTDDIALSSYTFKIQHEKDSINSLTPDGSAAYFYRNYQSASIFDTTQITISQIFTIDSLMSVTVDRTTKSYPIWEGIYQLHASVVDKQGNVATFAPIPIFIKYRSNNSK